jgi:tRNA threonylcarbamoyladenosine modification (KEOPS) complex Cgi121 subunit
MEAEPLRVSVRCYIVPAEQDASELKKRLSGTFPSVIVQVIDSAAATNAGFIELLAWQTRGGMTSGSLLAKTPEMDLLLRISGTTQISNAIKNSGARKGTENILIVAGTQTEMDSLDRALPAHFERLRTKTLTTDESMRVERAAMLNALRS